MANEVKCDGLGHYPISSLARKCAVCEKICRNSQQYKRSVHMLKHVSVFSMKSDNTTALLRQHVLYSLSKNILSLLLHKQTMHTVDCQCISHWSISNYREKSVLTIS